MTLLFIEFRKACFRCIFNPGSHAIERDIHKAPNKRDKPSAAACLVTTAHVLIIQVPNIL